MAARSHSPTPSRSSAHNPRTPDSSRSIRKSKEIAQRNSLSKPSSPSPRASFEQKENVKSRSPAFSKCSKNFMAPTVSAASKAVPPSTRKRILQERNEVINSVSNSFEFLMTELGHAVETENIRSRSEMGFGSQEVLISCDVKKGEPTIKNHRNGVVPPLSPLSAISPLDADPSLPPYDPMTNYLSPRPQFTHFRPNPRIEPYLNMEGEFVDVGDGKRLEDSFPSDSGEDDVNVLSVEKDSEEEAYPIKVEEVEEGGSPPKTLGCDPEFKPEHEELCSMKAEEVEELEEVESPSKTHVSGAEFKSEPLKRRPFTRPNMVAFLFVLIMAFLCLPLSDSPIISSSILKDQYPTKPFLCVPSLRIFEDLHFRDYFDVANENFHGISSRFRNWSPDPIADFTHVASPLKDDLWSLHLINVTSLTLDEAVGLDLRYTRETKQAMQAAAEAEAKQQVVNNNGVQEPSFAVNESDAETKQVMEVNGVGFEELSVAVHQSGVSEAVKEVDAEYSEWEKDMEILDENTEMMEDSKVESEKTDMVVLEHVKEDDNGAQRIEMDISENMIDADHVACVLEKQVIQDESSKELDQEAGRPSSEAVYVVEEVEIAEMEYTQTPYDLVVEPEIGGSEEDFSNVNSFDRMHSELGAEQQISHGHEEIKWMNFGAMLGLSLAPLALYVVFIYKKQKHGLMIEKERQTGKKVGSVSNSNHPCAPTKGTSHQNLQGDERTIGDSDSSEVSCIWNNTSSSGQQRTMRYEEDENLSDERRLRRDSVVSSSISYGSFTTYERLSAKKGGDEEVVTPVRRSSRIRSLLTSP